MMTSSNRNIFRVTCSFYEIFTGEFLGDLKRQRAHYDAIVKMIFFFEIFQSMAVILPWLRPNWGITDLKKLCPMESALGLAKVAKLLYITLKWGEHRMNIQPVWIIVNHVPVSEVNECESNPCQNMANCTDLVNMFTCNCTTGWNGTRCDQGNDIFC